MDNIYAWLGIAPTANEAEILAAIARKKQGYQINTTQEVHIKQVLLTPHLRKHHDARVAAADHPTAFATEDTAAFDINAQGALTYTPAENRMLATRTKLKKTKIHQQHFVHQLGRGLVGIFMQFTVSIVSNLNPCLPQAACK